MNQELQRLDEAIDKLLAEDANNEDGLRVLELDFPGTDLNVLVSFVTVRLQSRWVDERDRSGSVGGRAGRCMGPRYRGRSEVGVL